MELEASQTVSLVVCEASCSRCKKLEWVWSVCFETSEWDDWLGSIMTSSECLLDTWLKSKSSRVVRSGYECSGG